MKEVMRQLATPEFWAFQVALAILVGMISTWLSSIFRRTWFAYFTLATGFALGAAYVADYGTTPLADHPFMRWQIGFMFVCVYAAVALLNSTTVCVANMVAHVGIAVFVAYHSFTKVPEPDAAQAFLYVYPVLATAWTVILMLWAAGAAVILSRGGNASGTTA